MKNKKFLIAMLSACFLASCAFGVACKDKNDGPIDSSSIESTDSFEDSSVEEKVVEIALDQTEVKLSVYDKATLVATVKGSEAAMEWSSSAPEVATVDANGKITAIAVGEATITATVEGKTATCVVTVEEATAAPVIKLSSENVYLNIGGSFVSSVKTLWKGEEVEETVAYTWTVVEGQAEDVATATADGDEVTFNGLKEGATSFRVSADVRGIHVSKDVNVTVYGTDVSIVANDTAYVPAAGKYTLDLATEDVAEYKKSEDVSFVVYENGNEVKDAQIEWTVVDEDVITIVDNKFVSTGAGQTQVVGTCTVNDVTANVIVSVNVIKPIISLMETTRASLEVENLTTLTVESDIIGDIESVELHGKEILESVNGKTMSFKKDAMPKLAKELGEQTMYVSTKTVIYELPVTLYTMVINDKAEMDSFVGIAKNNAADEVGIWDGYFLLGNDINYNGEFVPMTSHNHLYSIGEPARSARYNASLVGFRGIFDGQGYNIDGLAIGIQAAGGVNAEAGIFGVINQEGIVRNISFTNAVSRENSGYIAASGGGLIENISITYKQIGIGAEVTLFGNNDEPRMMSSFYSTNQGVGDLAVVRNCFVDASNAAIPYYNEKKEAGYRWSSIKLAGKASVMENVIVICPNEALANTSGSPQTFATYEEFAKDEYAQGQFSLWDKSFWTSVNGIPFTVNMANQLDKDAEIGLEVPDFAYTGRSTTIGVIGSYTKLALAEEYEGVTYKNGTLIVTDEATAGQTITLVLTSYLNDQVVEKNVTIKKLQEVTLNQTEATFVASTDTTLDLSIASEYLGGNATVYVGTTVVGDGAVADNKVAIDMSAVTNMEYGDTTIQVVSEKDGVYYAYDLKIFYVTKVIRTVEDFKAVVVTEGLATPIMGYYILGNDIDFQGAKTSANKPSIWNGADLGFRGTFDGNGKTISNMAVANYGLFGHIGKGAVIKDVNFKDVVYSEGKYQKMGLLANVIHQATIQNINVNITEYHISTENNGAAFVEQGLLSGRYLEFNTIENVTFHAEGIELYRLMGRVSRGNKISNMTIYAKSYQTIGDSDDSWTAITELPAGVTFIADGEQAE